MIEMDHLRLSTPPPKGISRPKPFWELVDEILGVLSENNISYEQSPVYYERASATRPGGAKNAPEVSPGMGNAEAAGQWSYDNLFTRIVIIDALNEMEGAIQLAFNPYGIQLSFGLTHSNREIFAHLGEEDTIMSTYVCGDIKVLAYFVMMHKIRNWFPVNNRNVIEQLERSRALMNKALDISLCKQFIERFYRYSITYSDCLEEDTLVSGESFETFVEQLRSAVDAQFAKERKIFAWDLYNLGNALLRPDQDISLTVIIPLGFMWGGYVFSRLM